MPDIYTKAVLTVIAACLFVIAFRGTNLMPAAHAQDTQTHIWIDGGSLPLPIQVQSQSQ